MDMSKVTDKKDMFKRTLIENIPENILTQLKGVKNYRKALQALVLLYKD